MEVPVLMITFNGESRTLEGAVTIAELLEREGLGTRRVAVEINREIVPKSQHATHQLHEGDRVEVVHALGGG